MKISEIAELAGVSNGTVDRVIHNRGSVSLVTKKKINKIIKESNYKPNIIASNLKKGKTLKIGILTPILDSEEGYWRKCYLGMEKALYELSDFSVEIITKQFDRLIQGDLLEKGIELLNSSIDVLAFPPIIQIESYQLITYLKDIPYAFFDSPLKKTTPITENLQDPFKAGYCSARIMELFKPGAKTFLCLQMHDTASNLQKRTEGFCEYFKNKQATVLPYTWRGPINDLFYGFIDSMLLKFPNINGIFMTNSTVGLLADYLAKKHKEHHPTIIGFDLLEDNVDQLKNGNIDVLISQQPEIQGYTTIQEIFRIIFMKQQKTISTNLIPVTIVLKENLQD